MSCWKGPSAGAKNQVRRVPEATSQAASHSLKVFKSWLETKLARVPRRSTIAKDIRYGLSHCEGLSRVDPREMLTGC